MLSIVEVTRSYNLQRLLLSGYKIGFVLTCCLVVPHAAAGRTLQRRMVGQLLSVAVELQ